MRKKGTSSKAEKDKNRVMEKLAPDLGIAKNTLKNFFKNFVYVFVPMGTVYLFMLCAILLFATSTVQNLTGTLKQIMETVGSSIEQSSASVEEFLAYAFGQIDWNGNFLETLSKIFNMNWIGDTIKGFFETLSASTEGFDAQINTIVGAFLDKLSVDFGLAATIVAIGVWLANSVTRYVLRRRTAKRGVRNFLLAHTLVPLVQSAVVVVAGVLFAFIQWFALLVMLAAVALWAVISLMNSFIIYRDKDVPLPLNDVITPRNVASHILVAIMVLAIDIVVCVALWFVHPMLCVLIIIPFFIYSVNIIDLGTDSYVLKLVSSLKSTQDFEMESEND